MFFKFGPEVQEEMLFKDFLFLALALVSILFSGPIWKNSKFW